MNLDSALGKIATSTSKNPRQAISVPIRFPTTQTTETLDIVLSKFRVLFLIEKVFECVLNLDHLKRMVGGIAKDPNFNVDAEGFDEDIMHNKWKTMYENSLNEISSLLKLNEQIENQHVLTAVLQHSKGEKVILRALKYMSATQKTAFLSIFLSRFDTLPVSNIEIGTVSTLVSDFFNSIIPSITSIITDANFDEIITFTRILLERFTLMWLVSSKTGIFIMSLLISRAEIIQSTNPDSISSIWSELFTFIFTNLTSKFSTLFPSYINLLEKNTAPPQHLLSNVHKEEHYAWNFLIAVAIGCSRYDGFLKVLVVEMREKMVDTVKNGNEKSIENVDLFLKALGIGIDAKQLGEMY